MTERENVYEAYPRGRKISDQVTSAQAASGDVEEVSPIIQYLRTRDTKPFWQQTDKSMLKQFLNKLEEL